jgi:hypothetical protein
LVADDVVKAPRIWCDGGETIMDADHPDPLLGGRQCNELQVSGVNGVDKIGSYCIRGLSLIDASLSPTVSFTLRFLPFTKTERFLTFGG